MADTFFDRSKKKIPVNNPEKEFEPVKMLEGRIKEAGEDFLHQRPPVF
ncbi:MAG: hypothetical protein R6U96_03310 [Promethearchaeia archaeon]